MNLWLEINRTSGIEKRLVTSDEGGGTATAEGACPGCGAIPFRIAGGGKERDPRSPDDTYRSGGRCMSADCAAPVGWIYQKVSTIFGLEEDERVLRGRCRVY